MTNWLNNWKIYRTEAQLGIIMARSYAQGRAFRPRFPNNCLTEGTRLIALWEVTTSQAKATAVQKEDTGDHLCLHRYSEYDKYKFQTYFSDLSKRRWNKVNTYLQVPKPSCRIPAFQNKNYICCYSYDVKELLHGLSRFERCTSFHFNTWDWQEISQIKMAESTI